MSSAASTGRSDTDRVEPGANAQTYGSLASKLMCNRRTPEDDDS